jgi:2,4-diaminopentanoate dehydrogenase
VRNIRITIWGFGAMGSGMARMLMKKKGVEIVGVCDNHPDRVGKEIHDELGVEKGTHKPVLIEANIENVLTEKSCDIALCATDSFTKDAFPRLKFCLERKVNIISTAEEMAFPQANNPDLADKLNQIAKKNGVSILGTGINPGLILDLLVIVMTGCMMDVEHIEAKRVNSLSPFGPTVMHEQGVGFSREEFDQAVSEGTMAGHVGFNESVSMIASALGWKVEKFKQAMKPIITKVDRKSPYGYVKAGDVAGINMTGQGWIDGVVKIDMVHPQQIEPEMEGTNTGDYVTIQGTPPVNLANTPEVEGGIGTIAMCVNMIPQVINADPGLRTMIDLPVPHAIMGDFRDQIKVALA